MKDGAWEQVESLFALALEQPTEQRADYVRSATADPETADEVLSLLQAYDGRGRLDSLTDHLRGLASATASISASELTKRLASGLAGRYRFEREIGRGGMAVVFLVEDLKLHRRVALKVLHPGLSMSLGAPRFLQEIRIATQLAHPHILPLYDSGEVGGFLFYVMPYVEGESLRNRLRRERRLPLGDALAITREVADALSYAHHHHIVHRDIKPENILFQAGHAIVSDFGIASAMTAAGGDELSETGVILGTPAYMSPEQSTGGESVDGRADVYALGCVLFEMLAGRPPFVAQSAESILALKRAGRAPAVRTVDPAVPGTLERVLQRALATAPTDRYATPAELARDIDRAQRAAPFWKRRSVMLAASILAIAGVGGAIRFTGGPPDRPTSQYALILPPDQAPLGETPVAISPDGSLLAYIGPAGRGSRLWIKSRDRTEVAPLPGAEGAYLTAFSPDSKWLAFVEASQLKKVPVAGGPTVPLTDPGARRGDFFADSASVYGVTWLDNGTVVYLRTGGREIRGIPQDGGPSRLLWRPDTGRVMHPTPLPGGRGVLFIDWCASCGPGMGPSDLWALDLRTGQAHLVERDVIIGFYAPTGHLVFVRPSGELMAAPFDLRSLDTRGAPRLIQDSLAVEQAWFSNIALSQEGTLVVRAGRAATPVQRYTMVWVDRSGRETPVDSLWSFRLTRTTDNAAWSLSPDGRHLAVGLNTDAGDNIWVKRLPNGPVVRVDNADSVARYRPRWWPDGRSLFFTELPAGGLRRVALGSGSSTTLIRGAYHGNFMEEGAVTSDGRWLVVRISGSVLWPTGRDIYARRLGVDTALRPLIATKAEESEIALSPDDRWLAYVSDETGSPEVYLRPFPNVAAARYQVSSTYGVAPLWARNGRELFYVNQNREMVVVPVTSTPTLRLGAPRVLFRLAKELHLSRKEFYTPYDISPDGRRFIMARRIDPGLGDDAPLIVTENWFTELKRVFAH
jgi:tRNA A-37 threonylcarbamoyl transferase component Bud32